MIFRNDDVSSNTNILNLREAYSCIKDNYPEARIISGVTLFSQGGIKGSVYDDVPFKDKPLNWFYKVDSVLSDIARLPGEIASHGTIHVDHSKLSKDAQEMSILTSCNYLNTGMFIPPFNKFNEDTIDICKASGIKIMAGWEWKSFEFEKFGINHEYWYFHSWRFTQDKLREVLNVHSRDMGFV